MHVYDQCIHINNDRIAHDDGLMLAHNAARMLARAFEFHNFGNIKSWNGIKTVEVCWHQINNMRRLIIIIKLTISKSHTYISNGNAYCPHANICPYISCGPATSQTCLTPGIFEPMKRHANTILIKKPGTSSHPLRQFSFFFKYFILQANHQLQISACQADKVEQSHVLNMLLVQHTHLVMFIYGLLWTTK